MSQPKNAQEFVDWLCGVLHIAGADITATTTDGPETWSDADITIGDVQFYVSVESGVR